MMAAHGRLLLLACAACLGLALAAPPVRNAADCVNSNLLKVTGNMFPSVHQIQRPTIQERTTVQVAQNFEVNYGSTFKVVSNAIASANETYILYQCGTTAPDPTQLGLPATTKTFSVPLMGINAPDTTVLNFMKLLGIQDRVSYVTDAVDPCMQLLGSSTCGRSSDIAGGVSTELYDGLFNYGKNVDNSKAIMFGATAEKGPLHGAEYIKYVAAFFNKEAVANKVFAAIYSAYNDIYTAVASSTAARPVVAWLYYQKAYPTYKLPEQIAIKFHGFRPQYTGDAGGALPDLAALKNTYVDKVNVKVDYQGDIQLVNLDNATTIAALRAILANVDVVIDESYVEGDVSQYTVDSFLVRYRLNYSTASTDLKFMVNKQLLRLDGTANAAGRTAWFEEALARPDVVLHDLVSFITPAALKSLNDNVGPRLVRSLFPSLVAASAGATNGVFVLTSAQCPLAATGECSAGPKAICPAVYLDCSGKLVTATEAQPCAPSCKNLTTGQDGAAGRAAVAPAFLALLAAALAVVMGPFFAWL